MTMALLLICASLLFVLADTVLAAETLKPVKGAETQDNAYEKMYIQYYENYYIDMVKPGALTFAPETLQYMANVMWNTLETYVYTTCALFYYALDFNLASYFKEEINTIQKAMRSSVFEPLFLLGFAGSAIVIIKRMLKRDVIGVFGQFLKVIAIFIISLLVVRDSGTVIEMTTGLTSSIGTQILAGDEVSVSKYAARAMGSIWYNLAHLPWEYVEFGNDDHTEEDMLAVLLQEKNAPIRQEFVESWNGNAFKTERAAEKVGFLILYMIPLLIKCTIYIVMSGILLLLQLMAVLYVLLAPLILILAMFPTYENIISKWIRRFVEIQISALVLYFIVGLLFRVDEMLFQTVSQEWGWLVVLVVQVTLYVGVIVKRNELLGALSKMGIAAPRNAINNGVHNAKAAAIKSMAAARMLGVKVSVAQRGIAAAAKVTTGNGKTGSKVYSKRGTAAKKAVERPVMRKTANAAYSSSSKAKTQYSYGETTSSEPHFEHLRPTRVGFMERQVIFEFEPSERPVRDYDDISIQRPRMDAWEMPEQSFWEVKSGTEAVPVVKKRKRPQSVVRMSERR